MATSSNSLAASTHLSASTHLYPAPTRLEVFAAYERHMTERDALIAERIGCSPAYWASMRERNPAFWEQMERKAMMMPPRLSRSAVNAQRQERFAPGEYLPWSKRRSDPAATSWEMAGYTALLLAGCIFFGQRIPGVHEFLSSFFR